MGGGDEGGSDEGDSDEGGGDGGSESDDMGDLDSELLGDVEPE